MVPISVISNILHNKYDAYNVPSDLILEYATRFSLLYNDKDECIKEISIIIDNYIANYQMDNSCLEILSSLTQSISNEEKYDNMIQKQVPIFDSQCDISFLNEFLILNKICKKRFAKELKIDESTLYEYLEGKRPPGRKTLFKIFKYFNVTDYEKFKYMALNNSLVIPDSLRDKKYDISFLKLYLEKYLVSRKSLENATEVSSSTMSSYLNGKSTVKEERLKKILGFFKVSSYEELINMCEEDKNSKVNNIK